MKNCDRPIQEGIRVRLSGVVTVPYADSQNGQWKEILISSFLETRFKNVLARTTVLQRVDWLWHQENSMHLCKEAVALAAENTNDYRQILIKQNHLASTLPDLDPVAEVLLLVAPWQDFVFGTVIETGEMFSTHILFVQECWRQNSQTNFSIAKPNSNAVKPNSKAYARVGGYI
ncbi:hypothetical protein IQ244_31080 [Nostoc sp. LEGE 06077]|uniref:hypothetical protein n=1 Tax=Nostoc sp. LEGE 06077 TaxID=915325 RepID=UPI001882AC42|nr:hypothetical protein [Nostoc sp. LEGE 06077]MBE9210867.1 hypothetical protein [Nostoc sp. LEGE 06077]